MKRAALVLAAVLAAPAGLLAQTSVDQRRPAAPNGEVQIENMAGTITVTGWDKAEVWVQGTLAPEAELEFGGSEGHTSVSVEVDGNPLGPPRRSRCTSPPAATSRSRASRRRSGSAA